MKWSIVVSVVVCTWAGSLLATPVELAEAISVAQTWMARRGRLCQPVSGRTYIAQNGVNRFHVVGMSGGGFVALAANDELEPVLAFSDGANVSCEPGPAPCTALETCAGGSSVGGRRSVEIGGFFRRFARMV